MTKTAETKRIEHALWNFTHSKMGVYGCFEVTLGLGMTADHREIVDYVTYDKSGVIRCYEIKTSYADFKSHARKSWWGNFNYLIVTPEVHKQIKSHGDILGGIGIYVVGDDNVPKSVHSASNHQLTVGERVTIIESMVRSMDREVQKFYRIEQY
ncbi:hypothetical protein [Lactobacillus allii] [Lactiplantibacillus mudanjiangensis]|uniref:hypothetical protein n=1 Tax=Lactiplantibacillus mudanjiangensis TaxID=1296538 RepID=UPI001014F5B5|nr:hypothetical protein [Lactiplantibacillus mudanjiangensis]VDG31392.1 hypothetical protein [Lactobacillus allii] [Lactiplantibacillus mudanjiangensis]